MIRPASAKHAGGSADKRSRRKRGRLGDHLPLPPEMRFRKPYHHDPRTFPAPRKMHLGVQGHTRFFGKALKED